MAGTAEVIIIGAGVVGCSIAFHLARLGCHDVVVLEKDRIGSGSTEKCAGGIRQQFSTEINVRLSTESVRFFERFEDETGHTADFRQHGYMMLATTQGELDAFHDNVALQKSLGVEVYLLSPQEAREIVPQLNVEDVLGAAFCATDGYADPYSVVHGFASAARRMGVTIREDSEVVSIEVEKNRVTRVVTRRGVFEAPILVNAAGPYAGLVGKMMDLNIPVRPSRRHIFATEPIFQPDKSKYPMVIDFNNGFWFRKEGLSLIFGMRNPDEPEGFNTEVDWGFLGHSLGQAGCHRLPLLADTGIMRGQAGLHEDTPDCNAILGKAPDIDGFYLACGFSGHGFMQSPATGRIAAGLILGQAPDLDLSALALERLSSPVGGSEKCFI